MAVLNIMYKYIIYGASGQKEKVSTTHTAVELYIAVFA